MNDDKLRGMSGQQMIAAMAATAANYGGGYIPEFADTKSIERLCEAANKARCVKCLCKIPPGKAGRKCKACRESA